MPRPDVLVVLLGLFVAPLTAWAGDDSACPAALTDARRAFSMPARLLESVAMVESGRRVGGRAVPWPWTVNAAGTGYFYESKEQAVAAVRGFQAAGVQSIDVGCMQINLQMHPQAFSSLDEAFEPAANTRYGAQFLRTLYIASHSWGTAMTAYHSSNPEPAAAYARKLLAIWPEAETMGLSAGPAPGGQDPVARHDYTEQFARAVAADMALRRTRRAAAPPRSRSLLRVTTAEQRHGPGWPSTTNARP
jgi:hypothetical protein